MMKKGIDVSRWQGDINWLYVKDSGVEFAIIKAGGSDAGFYKDATFECNYEDAKSVGIPIGSYYIVGKDCKSREDGVADAKRFIEMLKGKTFEYPVYIDLELTAPQDKVGVTDAVIGFCETMEAAGYYCGIYASDLSGFRDRLDLSRLSAFDKWVANYSSEPTYVKNYGMWQKSSTGKVGGINGNVDVNIAYIDYPEVIKAAGLNGFPKNTSEGPASDPEQVQQEQDLTEQDSKPEKKTIKITIEYDEHIFSGLLEEQ